MKSLFTAFVLAAGLFCVHSAVHAQSAEDLAQLQQSIADKRAEIDALNSQLDSYKAKITTLSRQSASLQNDIALLENEIAMSKLDIASAQNHIDEETLELRIIDGQIDDVEQELSERRQMLSDLLFAMNKSDGHDVLDVVLNIGSVSDVFEAAQQLSTVNETMKSALEATKLTQSNLLARQADHEEKMEALAESQRDLEKKTASLELRKNAKVVLADATSDSENQYRTLMSELRSEQRSITNDVETLQGKLAEKLRTVDGDTNGQTVITWPVHGIVTTLFHDTTYPFRNLFEHSGLDIAVPVGTAVESAAPGYVAWARLGNMYGNYVIIVHNNGLATLYAHMSRIDVTQEQYVSRGQVIGLSGGKAGAPGSGFSTGPHVHFEVRLNGIPVNPLNYASLNDM